MDAVTRLRAGRFVALLVCGSITLGGCGKSGDELPRQPVSGSVTLDGKPLERGTISFQPSTGLPTAAGVPISGGSYSISRDEGLVPGSYKVAISSTPEGGPAKIDPATGTPPPPGQPTPPPRELLPKQYNEATTLVAEVKEGNNTFNYELKSAPKK
jgi:hypothetical protein